MPREYLLSVRLMTFMHEPFILDALEGIDQQVTNFDFEVVVGDDFSTDKTLQLIKNFKFQNQKVHLNVLDRPKGGDYWKARKKYGRLYNFYDIINNCKGEYIALLDGDDYWIDQNKLQKQVEFLENNSEFSGCFHTVYYLDERIDSKQKKIWRSHDKTVFNEEDTITKLSLFHTSSYLFRNSIFDFPNWFFKISSGDMALLALISKNGKLFLINDSMSVYRKNHIGVTNNEDLITYHKRRIELAGYINSYFSYQHEKKCYLVQSFHKRELSKVRKERLMSRIYGIFNYLKK